MAIDFNQLRVFVTLAELGSMTKAAKSLKMPVSRVSRTIARLEAALGTTLVVRTTRSFGITEAGKRLYQSSRAMMQEMRTIEDEFHASMGTAQGLVRVTTPEDLGGAIVAPILAELSEIYPALEIELICSDEVFDLVKSGIDIGLRVGKLRDSSLKTRRLGHASRTCVATPGYLKRMGTPRSPDDLLRHDCIELNLGAAVSGTPWSLWDGTKNILIPVKPRLIANHTAAGLSFALKDRGIVGAPLPMIVDHIKRGDLVRVLPRWKLSSSPVHLIYPGQRQLPSSVKAVLDHLEVRLRPYFVE